MQVALKYLQLKMSPVLALYLLELLFPYHPVGGLLIGLKSITITALDLPTGILIVL